MAYTPHGDAGAHRFSFEGVFASVSTVTVDFLEVQVSSIETLAASSVYARYLVVDSFTDRGGGGTSTITTGLIRATVASFSTLDAVHADLETLLAGGATLDDLVVLNDATIAGELLVSETARFELGASVANVLRSGTLNTERVDAGTVDADLARLTVLSVTSEATVESLRARYATVGTADLTELRARVATLGTLDASLSAAGTFSGAFGTLGVLYASEATLGTLDVDLLNIAAAISAATLGADNMIATVGDFGTLHATLASATDVLVRGGTFSGILEVSTLHVTGL
jgi:hypothetical protein